MATLDDIAVEIRVMCGNRLDMDTMSESCANQAVVTLLNENPVPFNLSVFDETVTPNAEDEGILPFPVDVDDNVLIDAVTAVAYRDSEGYLYQIEPAHPQDVMAMTGEPQAYPTNYVVIGTNIYFIPKLLDEVDVRILGVNRYHYLGGGDTVPLSDSLRPSAVAIGTAIAKLYLGEPEVADVLNKLANLLGQMRFGMKGKQDEGSAFGMKVRR